MQIKHIESVIKKSSVIDLFTVDTVQWIKSGTAMYPLYGLPVMSEDEMYVMLNIPDDKKSKYYITDRDLDTPENINFADMDDTEEPPDRRFYDIVINGSVIRPIKTSDGIVFIDVMTIKPFASSNESYDLYIRRRPDNTPYVAVKSGMMLKGILTPVYECDQKFCDDLRELYELCKMHIYNAWPTEDIDDRQDSLFDDD